VAASEERRQMRRDQQNGQSKAATATTMSRQLIGANGTPVCSNCHRKCAHANEVGDGKMYCNACYLYFRFVS
jgi:hypothetical protein